jgi:DnaK suppressor protein
MSATTEQDHDGFHRHARQMLTGRHQDTEKAWLQQADAVRVLRDSIEGGAPDILDRATIRAQADEQALLASRLRSQLDDLTTAIERCDAGTYGICERCGERIPDERLGMFPAATHCVPCKQASPPR